MTTRSQNRINAIHNLAIDRANISHGVVNNLDILDALTVPDGSLVIVSDGGGQTLLAQPENGLVISNTFHLRSVTSGVGILLTPSDEILNVAVLAPEISPGLLQNVSTLTELIFDNKNIRISDTLGNCPPTTDTATIPLAGAGIVCIGPLASTGADNTTAIGRGASATQSANVAIGFGTSSTGQSALAVGSGSSASGNMSVAIGGSSASAECAVAVGDNALASQSSAIAVGCNSLTNGNESICIGKNASCIGDNSIVMGNQAIAMSDGSVVLGRSASATSVNSIAIGRNASSSGTRSIAIGEASTVTSDTSIAIGIDTNIAHTHSLAIGDSATVSNGHQICVGAHTLMDVGAGSGSILLGSSGFQNAPCTYGHSQPGFMTAHTINSQTTFPFCVFATTHSYSSSRFASYRSVRSTGTNSSVTGSDFGALIICTANLTLTLDTEANLNAILAGAWGEISNKTVPYPGLTWPLWISTPAAATVTFNCQSVSGTVTDPLGGTTYATAKSPVLAANKTYCFWIIAEGNGDWKIQCTGTQEHASMT